jgi:hypothetical protein
MVFGFYPQWLSQPDYKRAIGQTAIKSQSNVCLTGEQMDVLVITGRAGVCVPAESPLLDY